MILPNVLSSIFPKNRSKFTSNSTEQSNMNNILPRRQLSTYKAKPFKPIEEFKKKYSETNNILGIGREGRKPVVEIFDKTTNQSFALKKLKICPQVIRATILQQNVGEECNFIVKIYEIFESREELYMVMEKGISHLDPTLNGNDLPGVLETDISQKSRRNYCIQMVRQVFSAVRFIHEKGYVHGDITLRNILVYPQPGGKLIFKLTDFENYIRTDNSKPEGVFHSTSPYRSAEILFKKKVTTKSDYWCLVQGRKSIPPMPLYS